MNNARATAANLPPWPTPKAGKIRDPVTRKESRFRILDEIVFPQTGFARKLICLQRVQFEEDARIEVRLGYYIIGKKAAMRGRWVWGQYATFLPAADFHRLIREVIKRKW
jgi:hypothetical protein